MLPLMLLSMIQKFLSIFHGSVNPLGVLDGNTKVLNKSHNCFHKHVDVHRAASEYVLQSGH